MALHTEIGKRFVRVVKARNMRDKEYLQEMIDYEGGNTDSGQLDNYVIDVTENYEYASVIGIDELNERVDEVDYVYSVFMYGSESDRRMWGSEMQVYIMDNGDVYLDEALEDMAFS